MDSRVCYRYLMCAGLYVCLFLSSHFLPFHLIYRPLKWLCAPFSVRIESSRILMGATMRSRSFVVSLEPENCLLFVCFIQCQFVRKLAALHLFFFLMNRMFSFACECGVCIWAFRIAFDYFNYITFVCFFFVLKNVSVIHQFAFILLSLVFKFESIVKEQSLRMLPSD